MSQKQVLKHSSVNLVYVFAGSVYESEMEMDNIQMRHSCSAMEQDEALLSPKRPRTDYTITNINTDKISFEFPKPMTFQTKCVEADHENVRHTGYQHEEYTEATSKRNEESQTSFGTHAICLNSTEGDPLQGKDRQNPRSEEHTSELSHRNKTRMPSSA